MSDNSDSSSSQSSVDADSMDDEVVVMEGGGTVVADGSSESLPLTFQKACPAECRYIKKARTNNHLYLMCFGLKDAEGEPLFDNQASPWKDFKRSKKVKPTSQMYRDEIKWRWLLKHPLYPESVRVCQRRPGS
jgi:hypothetical protein